MSCLFLNADLDVFSASPLNDLIEAIGDRAVLLRGGPGSDDSPFVARYEIDDQVTIKTPEALVAAFSTLIEGLSGLALQQWNQAARRVIDFGYEIDAKSGRIEDSITPPTLARLAALNITLAWTLYPKDPVP